MRKSLVLVFVLVATANTTRAADCGEPRQLPYAAITIRRAEVNQGLAAYPLIAEKSALVRLFIAPKDSIDPVAPLRIDSAELEVQPDGGTSFTVPGVIPNPLFTGGPLDYSDATNIHFFLGSTMSEGDYHFTVRLFNEKSLRHEETLPSTYHFKRTHDLRLLILFQKGFKTPTDLREDPDIWPYVTSALKSVDRVYPIRDRISELSIFPSDCSGDTTAGLQYMIAPDFIDEPTSATLQDYLKRFNGAYKHAVPMTCSQADSVMALGRAGGDTGSDYLNGNEGGSAVPYSRASRVYLGIDPSNPEKGAGYCGMIMAQEIGHGFGLVNETECNFDGGTHSINYTIADSSAYHLQARKSMTPKPTFPPPSYDAAVCKLPVPSVYADFPCRAPYGPYGHVAPTSVMSSRNDQDCVLLEVPDWKLLISQFAVSSKLAPRSTATTSAVFYLVAYLRGGLTFDRLDSRLLPSDFPVDEPLSGSPYEALFFNSAGQPIARHGFAVLPVEAHGVPPEDPSFTFAYTVSSNVARVDLRRDGVTFAAMTRSANAPEVAMLSPRGEVFTRVHPRMAIAWRGSDRDGDSLSYTLSVSIDGGQRFVPIGVPFRSNTTAYTWDMSLIPTTAQASDAFAQGRAHHAACDDLFEIVPSPASRCPGDHSTVGGHPEAFAPPGSQA